MTFKGLVTASKIIIMTVDLNKFRFLLLMILLWAGSITGLAAQKPVATENDFHLLGRIRCAEAVEISLQTVQGETLLKGTLSPKQSDFSLGPIELTPDLYLLKLGATTEKIYIADSILRISGYYDNKNPTQSNLKFEGLEQHFKLTSLPVKLNDPEIIKDELLVTLKGTEISALAYLYARRKFDHLKPFYEKLTSRDLQTSTGRWLQHSMDSLKKFGSGISAPTFTLTDSKGKLHSLESYRGKIVVLDFWASWCGPCRGAMAKMKVYYPEFKDQIQFISISVDDVESKWRKADEEEKIPWLSLWDKTGFRPASVMRSTYGFETIPFIVVINPQGKVLRTDIGSAEELKTVLSKLLQ